MSAKTFYKTPVIAGDKATFLWYGKKAPYLVGDFNQWKPDLAYRLKKARDEKWELVLDLPRDAYIEYKFFHKGKHRLDPGNSQLVSNGVGGYNNFLYMPEARATRLVEKTPGVARGAVKRTQLDSDMFLVGKERAVSFYRPPASGPYPLIVVYDGQDYEHQAFLPTIIDNLLAEKRIPPVALAMVSSRERSRTVEYTSSDATLDFLLERVLPAARERLDLVDLNLQPGAFGVMGASLGGLMALYTGLRFPNIFGRVLSQSGAFFPQYVVNDLVRTGAPAGFKVWIDVGIFDFLYAANLHMRDHLRLNGFDVVFQEYSGGHNYSAWRNDLGDGLESLFGSLQPEA